MSKRSLASAPSTPRKRKAKGPNDQSNLDAYFRKGDGGAGDSPRNKDPQVQRPVRSEVAISPTSNLNSTAGDEELARRLAEEDGIDIETLRRLEDSRTTEVPPKKKLKVEVDVIDVDLLDDNTQTPGAGSSSGRSQSIVNNGNISSPGKRISSSARGTFGAAEVEQSLPTYSSLSVDPLDYSLGSSPWPDGTAAPYSFLAHTLCTLSGTKSRILILNTLTNALRTIIQFHPASLCPALYLLSNTLAPPYTPVELGLGPSIISKAIQDVSGLTPAALRRLYKTTGDPGASRSSSVHVYPQMTSPDVQEMSLTKQSPTCRHCFRIRRSS